MKIEFVNAFVAAAYLVLESLGDQNIEKGKLSLRDSPVKGYDMNVILGVTGEVQGQVFYSLNEDTGRAMASVMLGMPVEKFDEVSLSAIAEFGNMVTGNAASDLGNNGFKCDITPPTLVSGKDISVSFKGNRFLVVPLITKFGEVVVNMALSSPDGE